MVPCKYLSACCEKQAKEEVGGTLRYAQALYAGLWLGAGSGAGLERGRRVRSGRVCIIFLLFTGGKREHKFIDESKIAPY